MEAMPAEKRTTKKPTVDQISTAITHQSARSGSPSQSGRFSSDTPTALSAEFSAPLLGLYANWKSRATMAIDSTCGKKYTIL
jgi:hypothetical protein